MPLEKINNHDMHYEVHGSGPPIIVSGGWGTFCHGEERHMPAGLLDNHTVVIFDHRGLASSGDDMSVPATTQMYADDVIALANHLGIERAHLVGIVGIGACIFQEVALKKPELVRSMVNTGTWAETDRFFDIQINQWLTIHREIGFEAFQRTVVMEAFDPEFLMAKEDRLLGPNGGWKELRNNITAQQRLTEAAEAHNTTGRLADITCPTLIVHNGRDRLTGPRLTMPVEQGIRAGNAVVEAHNMPDAEHVLTRSEDRTRMAELLLDFLARH